MNAAGQRPFARLIVPPTLLEAVLAHARSELPNEACGLLAGSVEGETGRATRHFPIRNDLASPTEYFTNPRDLLDAMKTMRAAEIEVLAIYHSHPASEPVPSKTDIARNYWGEAAMHLIVGLAAEKPEVRAWWIGDKDFEAAEMCIDSSATDGHG
jgi:[CysO sulfur-carrier protein]-S-L-cysteine hydrolase